MRYAARLVRCRHMESSTSCPSPTFRAPIQADTVPHRTDPWAVGTLERKGARQLLQPFCGEGLVPSYYYCPSISKSGEPFDRTFKMPCLARMST